MRANFRQGRDSNPESSTEAREPLDYQTFVISYATVAFILAAIFTSEWEQLGSLENEGDKGEKIT